MNLIKYFKKIFGKKLTNKQQNIEFLIKKIHKIENELRQMTNEAYLRGACCASCLFGNKFNSKYNPQIRRIELLKNLLKQETNTNYHKELQNILFNAGIIYVPQIYNIY